ncbi:MAG: trehalase family glycosidase [Saprospiraceae bacterium]
MTHFSAPRNLLLSGLLLCGLLPAITGLGAQTFSQHYHDLQTDLARGWNTWSYGSMLSHVLLPDNLMLRLNIRQGFIATTRDPLQVLDRLAWDTTGMVQPIAHTYDGAYTELLINDWKGNTIRVQSAARGEDLLLLVTPVKRSDVRFQLELEVGMLWGSRGEVVREEEHITVRAGGKTRRVAGTRPTMTAYHPYATPYLVFPGDTAVGIYTGKERTLAEVQAGIAAAEATFHAAARPYGDLAEAYEGLQTVIGWNTIYDPEHRRVITPVSRGWNEAWQGYVLFEWDTYLTAFICALDNKELAYANVFAVTKWPNKNGNIGHYQMADGTVADMSQPPIGSMLSYLIYQKHPEEWFLREIFPELLRWNDWYLANRFREGYLRWGGWPGAEAQIAAWESGLDNAPMYEGVAMLETDNAALHQLADVGLNSLYAADCRYLARIAALLGETESRNKLEKRADRFAQITASLWSEADASYLNKLLPEGGFSPRLSPTLFYPMIAEVPNAGQAAAQIERHYYDPEEFYGDYILPSVPKNDPSYDNIYWRGAIWPPLNFLTYLGFAKYDPAAAADLADKSYRMYVDAWTRDRRIYENINSQLGVARPRDQLMADHFYTWGGLMGIMKFMEAGYYYDGAKNKKK